MCLRASRGAHFKIEKLVEEPHAPQESSRMKTEKVLVDLAIRRSFVPQCSLGSLHKVLFVKERVLLVLG